MTVTSNMMVRHRITKPVWEIFLRKVDRAKRKCVEYPAQSTDLTSLEFYLCSDLKNTVYVRTWSTKLKLPVQLFHQQQCEQYATVLHYVVNNALGPVADDLNTYEFQVTNTTMG